VLAVNPIGADGIARPPAQTVATPPKAHSVLVDPANRHVYSACLGGDAVICQQFDPATGRLAADIHTAARTPPGSGPRHMALSADGRMLYVIAEQGGAILAYARDPATGALAERQRVSLLPEGVAPPVAAADLHLTPDGRFLYGSERTTHTLSGFAVGADGLLTPVCRVASEPTPRGFAISPDGRLLLCAGLTSGRLATYGIEPSGVLVRLGALAVGMGANWVEFLELGG
jgi:6-phosphogluconolactonase